jgi:alpha-L-fucosidase
MRYVVFTTKHHDGFCMFNTQQTDYAITNAACPFSQHPKADVAQHIFNAFRQKGFWTGAYFSKPDWHHPDYWAPEWSTPNRNVNYDPEKYPERWQRFCDFTYHQIEELMTHYGQIDILWLDGGWVRPEWSINEETRPWLGCNGWVQDVNMEKIATMARQHHPELIMVDRSVHGKYENYRTPEQQIPEEPLNYPWETCLTMGDSWSYVPGDNYKSTRTLIHLLADIVSKGGNLLLNVGPDANGELDPVAYSRMKEIGEWMNINGGAIYQTRPIAPFKSGKVCFTQHKNGTIYGIYLCDEEETTMPERFTLPHIMKLNAKKFEILGSKTKGTIIKTSVGYQFEIPKALQNAPPCKYAWVFKLQ